jgi:FdhD protein
LTTARVRTHREGGWSAEEAEVPREEPLTLNVNGGELVTLMATPGRDEELALGFLVGEGIIAGLEQVVELRRETTGIEVTAEGVDLGLRLFERRMLTSGCGKGVGFVTALDALAAPQRRLPVETPWVRASVLEKAALQLYAGGALYRRTRGTHAAALFQRDGSLAGMAEDIGRHNAVDKVMGGRLLKGGGFEDLFLVVTGRISSDMVSKAARSGVPLVASKSVATSLAIEYGQKLLLGLVGRVSRGRLTAYTFPELVDERA